MAKTALINARTEPDLKEEVEAILKKLGLSTTEAINIFFHQVKMRRGLPFPVEIPNEQTLKKCRDSEAGKGLVKCKDVDDRFTVALKVGQKTELFGGITQEDKHS